LSIIGNTVSKAEAGYLLAEAVKSIGDNATVQIDASRQSYPETLDVTDFQQVHTLTPAHPDQVGNAPYQTRSQLLMVKSKVCKEFRDAFHESRCK
jgi:hypothetical protein